MTVKERAFTLKVPRHLAEDIRTIVLKGRMFDQERSIGRDGSHVFLPIILPEGNDPDGTLHMFGHLRGEIELMDAGRATGPRLPRKAPFAEIRERLAPLLDANYLRHLPERWELIGDCLVLKLPREVDGACDRICEVYASVLGARFVLVDISGIGGELREPDLRIALPPARGTTEVIHTENGIDYMFDARRIMFSSGNVQERIDASTLTRDLPLGREPSGPGGREIVLDMFAGIGYFSLPMAKGDPRIQVVACEKNPASYTYLLHNIDLNGLGGRVTPILGDCREAVPGSFADRIVMGYVGGTIGYLRSALEYLSPQGGLIHLHDTVKVVEGAEGIARRAVRTIQDIGCDAVIVRMHKVKSYAPRTDHVVIDIRVGPICYY